MSTAVGTGMSGYANYQYGIKKKKDDENNNSSSDYQFVVKDDAAKTNEAEEWLKQSVDMSLKDMLNELIDTCIDKLKFFKETDVVENFQNAEVDAQRQFELDKRKEMEKIEEELRLKLREQEQVEQDYANGKITEEEYNQKSSNYLQSTSVLRANFQEVKARTYNSSNALAGALSETLAKAQDASEYADVTIDKGNEALSTEFADLGHEAVSTGTELGKEAVFASDRVVQFANRNNISFLAGNSSIDSMTAKGNKYGNHWIVGSRRSDSQSYNEYNAKTGETESKSYSRTTGIDNLGELLKTQSPYDIAQEINVTVTKDVDELNIRETETRIKLIKNNLPYEQFEQRSLKLLDMQIGVIQEMCDKAMTAAQGDNAEEELKKVIEEFKDKLNPVADGLNQLIKDEEAELQKAGFNEKTDDTTTSGTTDDKSTDNNSKKISKREFFAEELNELNELQKNILNNSQKDVEKANKLLAQLEDKSIFTTRLSVLAGRRFKPARDLTSAERSINGTINENQKDEINKIKNDLNSAMSKAGSDAQVIHKDFNILINDERKALNQASVDEKEVENTEKTQSKQKIKKSKDELAK